MDKFTIYCDDIQEGIWFQNLNSIFSESELSIIPTSKKAIKDEDLEEYLKYDRPDIILKHNNKVILVLERTVEVPSGHNVGQRFGRLAAAAENGVPVVYFGPYAAYKHGGSTAGPRYMNLRLFYALDNLSTITNTAITTINWPVDTSYEIIKDNRKDIRVKEYLNIFFNYYLNYGFDGINEYIINSKFQENQRLEQNSFALLEVKKPEQYNIPPDSVKIISSKYFADEYNVTSPITDFFDEFVVYNVGMSNVRSDPYTGMTILYKYLYILASNSVRGLILHFPNISIHDWETINSQRKDYRIFNSFSDAIIFSDGLLINENLKLPIANIH